MLGRSLGRGWLGGVGSGWGGLARREREGWWRGLTEGDEGFFSEAAGEFLEAGFFVELSSSG
jgi:hypothetical protein